MNHPLTAGDRRPPLDAPPEVRRAIEAAVMAVWPRDDAVLGGPSSGWPTASRRSWRFASRWWVSPVQLRRERPG
ncbi:MAG: hypothetical protein ABSA31_01290 [Acidimicrobiales bacterium]